MRPARDGLIVMGLTVAVAVVASISGQNLLALVACLGLSAVVVSASASQWNLRNLEVVRRLPEAVFAGRAAHGHLVLRNRRHLGAALVVHVSDAHGAEATAAAVPPRGEVALGVVWLFQSRGPASLDRVYLRSSSPLGWFECGVVVECAAELVVWPEPRPSLGCVQPGSLVGPGEEAARGGGGDFLGLRTWRPGDSIRQVHWRTTARVGAPVVVQRAWESRGEHAVDVPDVVGAAWEDALCRAAGAVEAGVSQGRCVRLMLPAEYAEHAPRMAVGGAAGHRRLLDLLALLPPREGE